MTIIGIDPSYSKPIAVAVWKDKKLLATFKFDEKLYASEVEALAKVVKGHKVFIEDQYFKANADTLKKLARCTGEIIGICKMVNTECTLVAPRTWQCKIGLYGKRPKELNDYRWKQKKEAMLIKKASEISNNDIEDPDIAAAILISYTMGVKNGSEN